MSEQLYTDDDGQYWKRQHFPGPTGKIWIADILRKLNLTYDDACHCDNCTQICNLIEGDPEAIIQIVLDISAE